MKTEKSLEYKIALHRTQNFFKQINQIIEVYNKNIDTVNGLQRQHFYLTKFETEGKIFPFQGVCQTFLVATVRFSSVPYNDCRALLSQE